MGWGTGNGPQNPVGNGELCSTRGGVNGSTMRRENYSIWEHLINFWPRKFKKIPAGAAEVLVGSLRCAWITNKKIFSEHFLLVHKPRI